MPRNRCARILLGYTLAALLLVVFYSPATYAAEETVKVKYLTWATGVGVQWIKEDFIQPFEQLHPNIKIEHEAVAFGQVLDKLMVYTASGNPPDLMHVSVGWVYELAQQGLIRNLEHWFNRDLKPADFFMEPMKAARFPSMETGDLYAIPFAVMMNAFYFNKTMFDNAGLGYPGRETSWFDVRDMGRKLAKDLSGDGQKDQWGFYSAYDYSTLDPILHSFGGRILDEDLNVRLTDEPALDAVRFMTDLIFKDQVAPAHASGVSGLNLFMQGKMGMILSTTPYVTDFRAKVGFDWDVAMVPTGPTKRVVRVWPDSFGIHSQARNAEAAWEYIKFVVTQTKMDRYTGDRKLPIYRPLATSKDWLQLDMKPNKRVLIEQTLFGEPLEFRPLWFEWDAARGRALQPAWQGKMAIETAMLQAWEAIRQIVKGAKS